MKISFCHSIKMFCHSVGIAALLLTLTVVGCKKTEALDSYSNTNSSEDSEIVTNEIQSPDLIDIDDDEDGYVSDATTTKIDSIYTEHGFAPNNLDVNGFAYKYAGYNIVKYDTQKQYFQQSNKFIIKLSQKDTLLKPFEIYVTSKNYGDINEPQDTTINTLTRIDDTHYFVNLTYNQRDAVSKIKFTFRLTPKKGVSKAIKKTIKVVAQSYDNRASVVLFNNELFGTTKYGIQSLIINETASFKTPDLSKAFVAIDSVYVPKEGDIIKCKSQDKEQYLYLDGVTQDDLKYYVYAKEMNAKGTSNSVTRYLKYKKKEFYKKLTSQNKSFIAAEYKRIY